MKKKSTKSIDDHYAGLEPIIEEIHGRSDPAFIHALNWYNYKYESGHGRTWLYQWMKQAGYSKQDIEHIRSCSDCDVSSTACWVSKMILNGTKFSDENLEFMRARVQYMINRGIAVKDAKKQTRDVKPVISIRERTDNKNAQIHAIVESEVIDKLGTDEEISLYAYLKNNNITQSAATYLKSKYQAWYDEITSDDPQVKEAFGKKLPYWQKAINTVLSDLDTFIGNKKIVKVRKPRVSSKQKPLAKVVEKLNYQKEFNELQLVSIVPQQIVGASSLWVYNTKSRILGVYHAIGRDGLNVKGTSVVQYDVDTSICKKVRKPELVIKNVLSAGKVQIKNILNELNTEQKPLTGRINSDTILLRVIK